MPSVMLSPQAILDLQRLQDFLREKNPAAAKQARKIIIGTLGNLTTFPLMGTEAEELGEGVRRLPIDYGKSGYIAAYEIRGDVVLVLGIKAGLEAGYGEA